MKHRRWITRRDLLVVAIVLAIVAAGILLRQKIAPRAVTVSTGTGPEELVYVRTSDDIVHGGAIFRPQRSSGPVAIVWVHGWGANFYAPSYVMIGRELARRGLPCIAVNTRMHDIGNVVGHRRGKRIRGGGYWGVASDEVRDLAAWIDFAEERGFAKVVLVGHSAGWSAVRRYQADTQDERVIGVVLASGAVRPDTGPADPEKLAEATRLVAQDRGDDLIRLPNRSFPSFVSAATFLDVANAPPEYKDFFGVRMDRPAVTRLRRPLLAFFGTRDDVGTAADLDLVESAMRRHAGGARVDTVMIRNADHMYAGEEAQVAETIARWVGTLDEAGARARAARAK